MSRTPKEKVQYFIPSTEELPDDLRKAINDVISKAANAGYLAALLDRGHVGVRYSKNGEKPRSVRIGLGESHPEAQQTWNFIMKYYGVEGKIRAAELRFAPSIQKRKAIGENPNKRTTYYLHVTDPADVLKLVEIALPFSERKGRLQEVLDACKDILAQR